MTAFDFMASEFPEIHAEADKAVNTALPDPRTSCFYARRVVEQSTRWAFNSDPSLHPSYDDTLSDLLNDPAFKSLMGDRIFQLARGVVRQGNRAVHESRRVTQRDSITSLSALFQFTYWFARTYCRGAKPPPDLKFDPRYLPVPKKVPEVTVDQLKELEEALELSERERRRALEKLEGKSTLEAELAQLRAEVDEAKKLAAATPDEHDYTEVETRDYFIDLLLGEAGWVIDEHKDIEVEVTGMPNKEGLGYVDYVLWGDDGLPLGLVEAKKTRKSPQEGQQQAKLYADRLEAIYGQRPVIFYTNGFEHWIWDDCSYPPRPVQGFYRKDELELIVQRRTSKASLAETPVSPEIVERYYQRRCIQRIGEAFSDQNHRKALVVMATGAGKTRTVIALSDVLIRANWAKRILFLADRTALVNQAVNAFKAFLPDSAPVNLVTDKNEEGRVYISTYPTMMNLINADPEGERRFGVGYFDLVVIDEAHRSVFRKYQAIFDYFDSLLVGLTATPREEISHNTYGLFDLKTGVPTDAYPLEEAVGDKFLVPFRAVSVPLKFPREGISYDELSDEEKEIWDELDWDDYDDNPPDHVDAAGLNKWLFNADTVDKVLETLMTKGVNVSGGDRLGKTIIFAKNQDHADFIAKRFNINYPHFKGEFARVITHRVNYGQSLIDAFSIKEKAPHIAVSVDMLDTGIDIPEVVNLVFFKQVRSKTKFWQMIGRGTRLCPDLFGPDEDKQFFQIFDFCQNFEFFNQHPAVNDVPLVRSVSEKRFCARLEMLQLLEHEDEEAELRNEVADILQSEVASMNTENFVVRPHRKLVEKYGKAKSWAAIDESDVITLAHSVASLPRELPAEPEEARRFDLLILSLQLAILRTEPGFAEVRNKVRTIAGLLEDYSSIPGVAEQMDLLAELQTDEWWEGVTLPMLENVRKRLRLLVQFIEKNKRKIIYTDFVDEMGEHVEYEFTGIAPPSDFEKFRKKTLAFLKEHKGEMAVEKVHRNWPITPEDMTELERILIESDVGTLEDCEQARIQAGSFGLFIRSLIGLDRAAAKEAFGKFLDDKSYSANQIEFVNLIIDDLSQNGVIEVRRFYESPFTDLSPQGPEELFTSDQIDDLVKVLAEVRHTAEVA
ncbi:MAG: DEAD/DEAH box helicase family protein [Acidimicrobiales bacterium]